MKTNRILALVLPMLLVSGSGVALCGQTDLSGTWELTLPPPPPPPEGDRQDGQARGAREGQARGARGENRPAPPPFFLVLEQDGEVLRGIVSDPEGQVGTATGSVQGEAVAFEVTLWDPEGAEHQLSLEGVVEEGVMEGTLVGEPSGPRGPQGRDAPERKGPGPEWTAILIEG